MFRIHQKLCTGCRICEMICSLTHEGEIAPKRSRIQIVSDWPQEEKVRVCIACKPKQCIEACPSDALSWDKRLQIDEGKCNSCRACYGMCGGGAC